MATRSAVLFGCVLLAAAAGGQAAEISVQAAVSSRRPYLGDPIRLQISVEHRASDLPRIDSSKLESLGFKSLGEPSRSHSRTIINGVSSEKFSHDFLFQFIPTRIGKFTIPAVEVRVGAETASTAELEIDVVGPEPQDFVTIELGASDRNPFPGEDVTLTIAVFVRRLLLRGDVLDAIRLAAVIRHVSGYPGLREPTH